MSDLPSRREIEEWTSRTTTRLPMEYGLLRLVNACLPVVEAMAEQAAREEDTGMPRFCPWCLAWHKYGENTLCPATQARDIMREVDRG